MTDNPIEIASLSQKHNDSVIQNSNHKPPSKFDIYLQDIIKNYNEYQKELYDLIKDMPSFQIFYNIVTKWTFCEINEKYYHIEHKQLTNYTKFKKEISVSFSNFIDALPKKIYKEYKIFLKLNTIIAYFELITSINGFIFDAPNEDPLVFHRHDTLLNTYESKFVTKTKQLSNFTTKDTESIHKVETHINELIGCDKILNNKGHPTNSSNAEFFLDWLAHQVQHPTELLRYTPVIYGVQEDEKRFFIQLLKAIICDQYVGVISSKELKSRHNAYGVERIVNIVEETHVEGKPDDFVKCELRNYITEPELTVNKRATSLYSAYNKTNYLFLTNYKHCAFFEEAERRYWIIASSNMSNDINNQPTKEYYTQLFEALEHKEALRSYFLERTISQEFQNYGTAPKTQSIRKLKELFNSHIVGYKEALAIISDKTQNYNEDIIISSVFFKVLATKGIKLRGDQSKIVLMQALGYKAYNRTIKYGKNNSLKSKIYIKDELHYDMITLMEVNDLIKASMNSKRSIH